LQVLLRLITLALTTRETTSVLPAPLQNHFPISKDFFLEKSHPSDSNLLLNSRTISSTPNLFNMKQVLFIVSLFASIAGQCQFFDASNNQLNETTNITAAIIHDSAAANSNKEKIKLKNDGRWRLDKNKLWTGGLVMLSGMAKGF
jgi:hypothetical protein